ncbi:MAG: hypothetical protein ABW140_14195, partial [Candidatus Sedimenticola sp. 6PFRAG1]
WVLPYPKPSPLFDELDALMVSSVLSDFIPSLFFCDQLESGTLVSLIYQNSGITYWIFWQVVSNDFNAYFPVI